ncbi:3-hydroxyacyl-ACP dehydratase FabZ [bacterium]|nr:3-hydroxyacyl-ACP dehydratase FabZ [candidate division CSSED10-310 bacterium]
MPELNIEQIQKMIYHRPPFLLVDRILDYKPGVWGIGRKNVTMNEPFFVGHFPGRPIMPGVLLIEASAQVAAVVLATRISDVRGEPTQTMGYFASVKQFKFKHPVTPGDQLRIDTRFTSQRRNIYTLDATVDIVDRGLAAKGELMFALLDQDPIKLELE